MEWKILQIATNLTGSPVEVTEADVNCCFIVGTRGQHYSIFLEQGATEALDHLQAGFVGRLLEVASRVRQELAEEGRENSYEKKKKLIGIYRLLYLLGDNGSKKKINKLLLGDDKLKVRNLLQHANQIFTELTAKPEWTRTGVLSLHDTELLDAVAGFTLHTNFCKMLVDERTLDVLSKLCAARDGHSMPSEPVAKVILTILNNTCATLDEKTELESDKSVKMLQGSGIVAQAFRLMTLPCAFRNDEQLNQCICVCRFLSRSPTVIRRKMKSGTPTGDILDAVLRGDDGGPVERRSNAIMEELQKIQKMARMTNEGCSIKRSCRKCSRKESDLPEGTQLSNCSRCLSAFYCSKLCQKQDWPSHKNVCAKVEPDSASLRKTNHAAISAFIDENYFPIMRRFYELSQQHSIPKSDMVLVLDFWGDAPALKGEFEVSLLRDHLEGDRPAEPDWFDKGVDGYEEDIEIWKNMMRDHHTRVTSDFLLLIYRSATEESHVTKIGIKSAHTGRPMLSDRAMECVGTHNVSELVEIVGLQFMLRNGLRSARES